MLNMASFFKSGKNILVGRNVVNTARLTSCIQLLSVVRKAHVSPFLNTLNDLLTRT